VGGGGAPRGRVLRSSFSLAGGRRRWLLGWPPPHRPPPHPPPPPPPPTPPTPQPPPPPPPPPAPPPIPHPPPHPPPTPPPSPPTPPPPPPPPTPTDSVCGRRDRGKVVHQRPGLGGWTMRGVGVEVWLERGGLGFAVVVVWWGFAVGFGDGGTEVRLVPMGAVAWTVAQCNRRACWAASVVCLPCGGLGARLFNTVSRATANTMSEMGRRRRFLRTRSGGWGTLEEDCVGRAKVPGQVREDTAPTGSLVAELQGKGVRLAAGGCVRVPGGDESVLCPPLPPPPPLTPPPPASPPPPLPDLALRRPNTRHPPVWPHAPPLTPPPPPTPPTPPPLTPPTRATPAHLHKHSTHPLRTPTVVGVLSRVVALRVWF